MSKPDALLPCPFCGGEAASHTREPSYEGADAGCQHCDLWMMGDNEAEAIAAWNRRAGQSHTDGLVAALEAIIAVADGPSNIPPGTYSPSEFMRISTMKLGAAIIKALPQARAALTAAKGQ